MKKKVVIVHDFLVTRGGAERVLREIADIFPDAPIYTLLYDKEAMKGMFSDRIIQTSMIQNFPSFLRRRYRWLFPFFSFGVEAFDLREFDVVISSSGAWSKGVITRVKAKHLAYIHSPMRFVWDYNERYRKASWGNALCRRFLLSYLRVWDRVAADRPDRLVVNSQYTQERVRKYYRRESSIVYPPVILGENIDVKKQIDLKLCEKRYFLIVSRLTQSKNILPVIEAFQKLRFSLVIIGEGYDAKRIQRSTKNITFLGWQPDKEVVRYMVNAQALIFPAEDDFGMVAVEAMQMGTPVIALGKGGAKETIEEGVSGIFFEEAVSVMIADAVRRFLEYPRWDRIHIREKALQFSRRRFREGLLKELEYGVMEEEEGFKS